MIAEWHDKFDATLLEYAQTKVSGALADDLVADTWTQAWLSLDKFTGDPDSEEPLHWLKWMLGNLLKDKIKSETRRKKREKAPRKRQETHMQADAELFREIVRTEAPPRVKETLVQMGYISAWAYEADAGTDVLKLRGALRCSRDLAYERRREVFDWLAENPERRRLFSSWLMMREASMTDAIDATVELSSIRIKKIIASHGLAITKHSTAAELQAITNIIKTMGPIPQEEEKAESDIFFAILTDTFE